MKLLSTLIFLTTLFTTTSASARVELFGPAKPAISENEVTFTMLMRDEYKNCEEMGIVHSRNFTAMQTKKGMFKRMKKQAAKVGANLIVMVDTRLGQWTGLQQGDGMVFYCAPGYDKKK